MTKQDRTFIADGNDVFVVYSNNCSKRFYIGTYLDETGERAKRKAEEMQRSWDRVK